MNKSSESGAPQELSTINVADLLDLVNEVYLDMKKTFDISDREARRIYIDDYIKGGNATGINPYLSDAEYRKIKRCTPTVSGRLISTVKKY